MYILILSGIPRESHDAEGHVRLHLDGSFTLYRTEAGYMGEQQLDVPMVSAEWRHGNLVTDAEGLVTFTSEPPPPVLGVHKAVIQIPIPPSTDLEELQEELKWDESDDRTGPHIRVSSGTDAETGEESIFIRCKHRDYRSLQRLVTSVHTTLSSLM